MIGEERFYILCMFCIFRGAELFKKVQSYNEHHENKRGQSLSLTEVSNNMTVLKSCFPEIFRHSAKSKPVIAAMGYIFLPQRYGFSTLSGYQALCCAL